MHFVRWLVALIVLVANPGTFAQSDSAPSRPTLPDDIAAEVEQMETRIDKMRMSFLRGETESLDEAIEMTERILAVRVEHQTGWTGIDGNSAEWYEVGDARRASQSLRVFAACSPEDRTALLEAESTLEDKMMAAFGRGDYAGAATLVGRQLETRRRVLGDDHPDTLSSINNTGLLLKLRGKLSEAEPYYREALDGRRRVLGDDHPDTLLSINNLGLLLKAQGSLSEAEPYYREALGGSRRVLGDDHPDTLLSINNTGFLLHSEGKLSEAEPYYREALDGRRRVLGDDHRHTLSSINNMGALLESQGSLSEAEVYYREALDGKRRVLGDDHPDTLLSINNVGYLLHSQGKLSEAGAYYREALDGKRRVLGDDHPDTLLSMNNMGYLLQSQGKLSEAEPYYREALDGSRRVLGDDHPSTLGSINNMGALLQAQGKRSEAEPYYREALEGRYRVLGDDHPITLNSISNMGVLLQKQGRLSAAELYSREALDGCRRVLGDDHVNTLISINNMGSLLDSQRRLSEAEPFYREALAIAQRLRGSATGGERGRAAMAGQIGLRGIVTDLSNLLARRSAFNEAWTITEQGRGRALLDLLARSEDDLEVQLTDATALESAKTAETEAKVALNIAESRLAAMEKERAVIERDASLDDRARAARLAEFDQSLESRHDAILRARRDLGEATAEVFLALQDVMPDARPLAIEQIQSGLEPGDLLLGYSWSDDRVLLLTATQSEVDGAFVTENEEDTKSLTDELTALRDTLAWRPERSTPPDITDLLARLVPEALRGRVAAAGRVIILPDGPLAGIPFEAIADESILDDGRQQIVYASSATVYLNRRNVARRNMESRGRNLVALGAPVFERDIELASGTDRGMDERIAEASLLDVVLLHGGTLPRLPGTRIEVERIGEVVGPGSTILIGEDATLANLEASVDGARYVHIATHGLVGSQDRPYDASLALTRPVMPTVDDIGFLTLDHLIRNWRGKLESCDLVTLSACDTQRGVRSGDALMSLPWGFYYAGAPTVVASLWQIDDEATALLMSRFYENLLGSHEDERTIRGITYANGDTMPKADALQESKRWLRTYEVEVIERGVRRPGQQPKIERPYEHPYYWAAFVLIGDPG